MKNKLLVMFFVTSILLLSCDITGDSDSSDNLTGDIKFVNYWSGTSYSITLRCSDLDYTETKILVASGSVIFYNLDTSEYYSYNAIASTSGYPQVVGTTRTYPGEVTSNTIR